MSDPDISIIVVIHNMARQAKNTLTSLVAPYQRNVRNEDYEIIVVENNSDDELGRESAEAMAGNVRYFHREEPGQSTVPAINFALQQCRGDYVGLLIDGARMATPRIIEYVFMARKMEEHPLVALPGYHLGEKPQHRNPDHGPDDEIRMLEEIRWPEDGYKLFEKGWFSGGNPQGMLCPIEECHFFFAAHTAFERIGGADARFDRPGGGAINAHMWRAVGMLPEMQPIILAGEGTFHQYHGGRTTAGDCSDVLATIGANERQLQEIWKHRFEPLSRAPILLGPVSGPASRFVRRSANRVIVRQQELSQAGGIEWPDDCLAAHGYGQFESHGSV